MAEVSWTKDQEKFINAKRGPILVSAAAGSGKTAAIVERVCRRLADKKRPLYARKLLMTTFTNAAAGEMQTRIEKALYEKIEADPENEYLQEQYDNLSSAQIGTIHSLCFKILRENFSAANIFCDYRVANEKDMELLKLSVAEEVISNAYENRGEEFLKLVELVCNFKNDRELKNILLGIYDKIIAMPFPEDELEKWLENSKPTEESYNLRAEVIAKECKKNIEIAQNLISSSIPFLDKENKVKLISEELSILKEIQENLEKYDFEAASKPAAELKFSNNSAMKYAEIILKKEREFAKNILANVTSVLEYSDKENFIADQTILLPQIECLFSLTLEFMQEFERQKREKNVLDFNDAEQLVLKLLFKKENGEYVKTDLAKELSLRYDEIYIDEYQDINAAQEMIFEGICREDNVYMVGDIKQSIYGFRQSDPEIFKAKRNEFYDYDGVNFPARIFFKENFRSREEITGFVNNVFEKIMTEKTCGSEYGDGEKLVAKGKFPQSADAGAEMLFYEMPKGSLSADETRMEAKIVAQKIDSMVKNKYQVNTKEGLRDCRCSDFCIMIRSDKGKFDVFAEELANLNIQSVSEKKGDGFLETREVRMLRAVLKTINNPYDDIALCAAMISPLFAFSPTELALIREGKKYGKALFDSVKESAENGNKKAQNFVETLRQLQRLAACQSVDNLLSHIYNRHGFYNMVAAMNDGEIRVGNLDLMRYYSRSFEQNGYKGLADFSRFIEKLAENSQSLVGSKAEKENLDAVKIMTVHKSKGLEFPICFLSKSGIGFIDDSRDFCLINKKYGFASKIKDSSSAIVYKPFSFRFLLFIEKQKMIEEEMRLLYVALTRPKEKLFIPVVKKNIGASLDKAILANNDELVENAIKTTTNHLDWMLLANVKSKALQGLCNEYADLDYTVGGFEKFTAQKICEDFDEECEIKSENEEKADAKIIKQLNENALYEYPYTAQTEVVSKYSVSEIAKGEKQAVYDFEALPEFMKGRNLSGAERGTALHTFMQFANLENAQKDVEAEIEKVRQNGFITEAQASVIEREKVKTFLSSPLFERMKKANEVYKEYKVTTGVDSSNFGGERTSSDIVILQGVADCVLIEGDSAVIIDYKTDFVKEPAPLIERYTTQLSIYKVAVEKALGIPVSECIIYSFSLDMEVKIKPNDDMFN